MRLSVVLGGLGLLTAVFVGQAAASGGHPRPSHAPYTPSHVVPAPHCPPTTPPTPTPQPPTTPTPQPPTQPTPEQPAEQPPAPPSVSPADFATPGGEAGGTSLATVSNMFGDEFGSRRVGIALFGPSQFIGVADPNFLNPNAAAFGPPTLVSRVQRVSTSAGDVFIYVNPPAGQLVRVPGSRAVNVIPSNPAAGDFPIVSTFSQPGRPAPAFLLANNLGLSGLYAALPTSTITPSAHVLYDIAPVIATSAVLPGTGGVVGRTKIADDNCPLPRDRIIFNYDYFNGTPLAAGGVGVHRFSAGFEKTFFDSARASIEVRLPFASTLSSDVVLGGSTNTGHAEFGNLHLTLKALLVSGDVLNIAAGLGIALPTADDVRVRTLGGTDLLRVRNDAVLLEPYVAALLTPTDRLFFQSWVQFAFNANSNRVDANLNGNGLQPVGRLYDHSYAFVSTQAGYWVYQSDCGSSKLTGLAPFVELHYNATMGGANSVQAGLLRVGDGGTLSELNISAGFTALFGTNFQLMIGASAPLFQGEGRRTFDYQLGVRGNLFFGPTARARAAALAPSTF